MLLMNIDLSPSAEKNGVTQMTIIQIKPLESGQHPIQSQNHRKAVWLPGYIEVPPHLEALAWASGGWCELTIEDGKLVGVTPTEKPEPPAPEPTEAERLRADVDFLAAVQGVSL